MTRRWRCAWPRACSSASGFDPVDQLERYVRWWKEGYLSSTGECFDIGRATRLALQRFRKTGEPYPGDADTDAAGQRAADEARADPDGVREAADGRRALRGRERADDARRAAGARCGAVLRVGAGRGAERRDDVLRRRKKRSSLHPEVKAVAAGSFLEKSPPEIRGNGYIVLALEAALWAVASTRHVRGRGAGRGQPRRRRGHDGGDRRAARRRDLRRRRHPASAGATSSSCTTRSRPSPIACMNSPMDYERSTQATTLAALPEPLRSACGRRPRRRG